MRAQEENRVNINTQNAHTHTHAHANARTHANARANIANASRSPSDEVFQDATLASRLAADDGDLRQVDSQRHAQATEGVLQAIDDGDQLRHPRVSPWSTHDAGGGGVGGEKREVSGLVGKTTLIKGVSAVAVVRRDER